MYAIVPTYPPGVERGSSSEGCARRHRLLFGLTQRPAGEVRRSTYHMDDAEAEKLVAASTPIYHGTIHSTEKTSGATAT